MKQRSLLLLLATVSALVLGGCDWFSEQREVTTSSDAAYAAYKEGQADLARFRIQDARDGFAKATELDPEFAMAYADLAISLRRLGQRDESNTAIKTAFEKRVATSELEQIWIAHLHAAFTGDKDGAQAAYQELLEKYPEQNWTLRLRAEEAKKKNDFAEALECYDKILAADPEAVSIHNLKGYLYLSTGEYEKAIESLRRYAFYAPEQANPHDSLGEAFLSTGRFEEAISEFVIALEIDPTFVWSGVHLAEALSITGQTRKAHSVMDQIKPVFEERNWTSWWEMQSGKIDYRAERWETLLASVESAPAEASMQEIGSEYGLWMKYARTIALLELGDVDAAAASAKELEEGAAAFGEQNKAMVRITDIMKLNYAYIESRFHRAMGKPADSVDELKAALAASQLSPHELSLFRYELALALLESDRPAAAAAAANEHLAIIPTSPSLNLVAARAYDAAGETESALEHLRVYMDVMRNADEDHPQLLRATRLLRRLVPRS